MTQIKKLTLDYSKWRCGGIAEQMLSNNVLGAGLTALHNQEGFECCIGQFCLQCGATIGDIIDIGEPADLDKFISPFNNEINEGRFVNSKLSNDLIRINDHAFTTPEQKIQEISNLLAEHYIELEVINKPITNGNETV